MVFVRRLKGAVAAAGLICGGCVCTGHSERSSPTTVGTATPAESEFWPKGGVGVVHAELYVDLKSTRNELLLGRGRRWTGAAAPDSQVVFVWRQSVFTAAEPTPPGFRLAEACVVSFESEVVRFMDFESGTGGFYRRTLK